MDNSEKTFIFVYYAGHGIMHNFVEIVCNVAPSANPAEKIEKIFYPLEKMCRSMGKLENTYVMAIFDCCREDTKPEMYETKEQA